MKFSPVILIALPAAVCFLVGRWTATPPASTPETAVPSIPTIPTIPITATELAAEYEALKKHPWQSEAHKLGREAILAKIERADAEAIFLELARKPKLDPSTESQVAYTALHEMLRRDPERAWEAVMQTQDENQRKNFVSSALHTLLRRDPDLALQKVQSLPAGYDTGYIVSEAIRLIAETDPQRAIALAVASKDASYNNPLQSVFRVLAKNDLAQAQAAAAQLEPEARRRATKAIVEVLAHTDPAAAWKIANSSGAPVEATWRGMHDDLMRTWARKDPQAALAAINDIAESGTRAQFLAQAIQSWGNKSFDDAFDYAMQLSEPALSAKSLSYLIHAPKADHQLLFDTLLDKMEAGDTMQSALNMVGGAWARKDPQAAIQAVAELPQGKMQSEFARQIFDEWIKRSDDTPQMLEWVASLPEGQMRTNCLDKLIKSTFEGDDPRASFDMIAYLPADEQAKARASVLETWSKTDPRAAFDWAKQLPDGKERTDILRQSISQMAASGSPAEALAALQSQPALAQDKRTLMDIAYEWSRYDPVATERWTRTLPAGVAKDNAIYWSCYRLAASDPRAALAAAANMGDAKERAECIWKIAALWKQYDPAIATAYIKQHNLQKPENIREWDVHNR